MTRRIMVAFCAVWVMGMTAWVSGTLGKDDPERGEIIELRADVMEVAQDCSWVIVGETRFLIGSRTHDGERLQSQCLDVSGAPLKNACALKPHDHVHAKGVRLEDRTIMAVTLQKRAP